METAKPFITLPLSGLRGLIVEDSKLVAKVITDKLQEEGVNCVYANSGLEAFTRLNDEHFDFIIAAHYTKKINGFQLIEMLNIAKGANPNLRTCLITASDSLSSFNQADHHVVLQKNLSLTRNLIVFLQEEFVAK